MAYLVCKTDKCLNPTRLYEKDNASDHLPAKPKTSTKADSQTDCHWKVTETVCEAVETLACVEPDGTALA